MKTFSSELDKGELGSFNFRSALLSLLEGLAESSMILKKYLSPLLTKTIFFVAAMLNCILTKLSGTTAIYLSNLVKDDTENFALRF